MNVTSINNPAVRIELSTEEARLVLNWAYVASDKYSMCEAGRKLFADVAKVIGYPVGDGPRYTHIFK